MVDLETMYRMLLTQADVVATRLRADGVRCQCVAVSYRTITFKNKSHQRKLATSTDVTEVIYRVAKELITESWQGEPLRLIGLSLTDIDHNEYEQMSFIVDERKEKMKKLDTALDSIRSKYGNASIKRASTIRKE